MSSQDNVERVLKEIHVAFSKSPTYNNEADKIVVDRRMFLELLDRLNRSIYGVMEQYEQTRQSRQNAERSLRREGNEIIERANSNAEDIYAASVIYTSDTVGRIRDLMDQTNESMNDLFRQFRRELRDQKDQLKSHELELESQLEDLADKKKYLSLLREINRERDRLAAAGETRGEVGSEYIRNLLQEPAPSPGGKPDGDQSEREGTGKADLGTSGEDAESSLGRGEESEVKVNRDAAYFKWKLIRRGEDSGEEDNSSRDFAGVSSSVDIENEPKEDWEDVPDGESELFSLRRLSDLGERLRTLIFGKDEDE